MMTAVLGLPDKLGSFRMQTKDTSSTNILFEVRYIFWN